MTNTSKTPLSREPELIAQNTAATIYRLMRPAERNDERAAEIAARVIVDVTSAWSELLRTEPQAAQWSANGRYLRARAILVERKHDVSDWSVEYELVRYLVWALAPEARIDLCANLLHGAKEALDTKLATYLAERGTPKAPGDDVYGWQDSDKQFHTRVCRITHVSEVHEDKWDQFNDTFRPNSVKHGLTGVGACACGYVSGELRAEADLSEMLGEVLRG